jgi:hypothetical protein
LEIDRDMVARALTFVCALVAVFASGLGESALADRIKHPKAVFAGLDKITGRIIAFEVAIDETVQFGSLQITPRVCYTRPLTEAPMTTGFVEVEEAAGDKKFQRVFGGWMYAASPGLHGIEHAVYDAWLTDCKGGTEVIADAIARVEPDADPALKAAPATAPRARRQSAAPSADPVTAPRAPSQQTLQPLPPVQQNLPPARTPARAPDLGPPGEVGVGSGGPPRPPGNVGRAPAPPAQPPLSAQQQPTQQQQPQQRRQPSQSFFPSPF